MLPCPGWCSGSSAGVGGVGCPRGMLGMACPLPSAPSTAGGAGVASPCSRRVAASRSPRASKVSTASPLSTRPSPCKLAGRSSCGVCASRIDSPSDGVSRCVTPSSRGSCCWHLLIAGSTKVKISSSVISECLRSGAARYRVSVDPWDIAFGVSGNAGNG